MVGTYVHDVVDSSFFSTTIHWNGSNNWSLVVANHVNDVVGYPRRALKVRNGFLF